MSGLFSRYPDGFQKQSGQIALMDSGKSSVVKRNELLIDAHGDPDFTACPTTLDQRLRNILLADK